MNRLSFIFCFVAFNVMAAHYYTPFPLTENPISEGGRWTNGAAVGLDWADCLTTNGNVSGNMGTLGGTRDATALIGGTWGSNQSVTATVYLNARHPGHQSEVEMRLRSVISAHVNRGYEVTFQLDDPPAYNFAVVRWNGPYDSYTIFQQNFTSATISNANVLKASISNTFIRVFLNGTMISITNDPIAAPWTNGNPGIGFYHDGTSLVEADAGFTAVTLQDDSPSPMTNMAASLSDVDVQAAINLCSSNDVALMPSGTGTWSNSVTVPNGVKLIGFGTNLTSIIDQANAYACLYITNKVELANFTISSADTAYSQRLLSAQQGWDWRVHNLVISNVVVRGFVVEGNGSGLNARGVVDHCSLYAQHQASPGDGTFQIATIQGAENNIPPTVNSSAGSLAFDPLLGTTNSVYFENCLFSQDAQGDSSLETYLGGKVVVRFCLMTNFFLGVHGNDSSYRSGHSIEVYNNTNWVNLGTDYIPFVSSRGGTGLVFSNRVTHTSSSVGNAVLLQNYRAAGQLAVDQPDYTLRFPYNMSQLDGHSPYDGNTAVAAGSGTHNGSNGASALSDSTKSWGADAFLGNGTYSSSDNLQPATIWNRTDGSHGRVTANTATTVTATLSGGTRNNWNSGDQYVITFGYPGLDQNGWSGPTTLNGTYATQTLKPWYQWSNTFNGSAGLTFSVDFLDSGHTTIAQPQSDYFIAANREYYDSTIKPNYTTLSYPHPLITGSPATQGGETTNPPAAYPGPFYVATNGSDTAEGSITNPVATFGYARLLASTNAPATIYVRGGTYYQTNTLALTAADGRQTWTNYPGEVPILVGGLPITNMQTYSGSIKAANVSTQGYGSVIFHQLFQGTNRQWQARYPNYDSSDPYGSGWLYVAGTVSDMNSPQAGESQTNFTYTAALPHSIANPTNASVFIFPRYNWWNNIANVYSINTGTKLIELKTPTSYTIRSGDRYYLQNVFEELDVANEWYLNTNSVLYFYPSGSETVIGSMATNFVTVAAGASNIMFAGFTMYGCDGAAVTMTGTSNCIVARCSITGVGDYNTSGIEITGGYTNGACGNDISYVGRNGITISGGTTTTLTQAKNYAQNNYIHHTGVAYKEGVGVHLTGVGNRASYNYIHTCPRFGIYFQGQNLTVEYNHIRNVMLETDDGGIVYTEGIDWLGSRESIVKYNYLHDADGYGFDSGVRGTPYTSFGLYLDGLAGGVDLYGNVVAGTSGAGIFVNGGSYNRITNNIVYLCDHPASALSVGNQSIRFTGYATNTSQWSGNVAAYTAGFYSVNGQGAWSGVRGMTVPPTNYPYGPSGYTVSSNFVFKNIFWYTNASGADYPEYFYAVDYDRNKLNSNNIYFYGQSVEIPTNSNPIAFATWQAMGEDTGSIQTDPLITSPGSGNFTLSDSSPAITAMGFVQIPMSSIGAYYDSTRASWPLDPPQASVVFGGRFKLTGSWK